MPKINDAVGPICQLVIGGVGITLSQTETILSIVFLSVSIATGIGWLILKWPQIKKELTNKRN